MELLVEAPECVAVGERFTVAVLLLTAEGEAVTEGSAEVHLCTVPEMRLSCDRAELCFGEALFTDVMVEAEYQESFTLSAHCDALSLQSASHSMKLSTTAAMTAPQLLDSAVHDKAMLHLTMAKAKLWSSELNRNEYIEGNSVAKVLDMAVSHAKAQDAEVVIVCLQILVDLLSFEGGVRLACAGTQAAIPAGSVFVDSGVSKYFHLSAFVDVAGTPFFDATAGLGTSCEYEMYRGGLYQPGTSPEGSTQHTAVVRRHDDKIVERMTPPEGIKEVLSAIKDSLPDDMFVCDKVDSVLRVVA